MTLSVYVPACKFFLFHLPDFLFSCSSYYVHVYYQDHHENQQQCWCHESQKIIDYLNSTNSQLAPVAMKLTSLLLVSMENKDVVGASLQCKRLPWISFWDQPIASEHGLTPAHSDLGFKFPFAGKWLSSTRVHFEQETPELEWLRTRRSLKYILAYVTCADGLCKRTKH